MTATDVYSKRASSPLNANHIKKDGVWITEKRTATTIQPKDRFGGLVVIRRGKDDKNGKARYWCNCDCGKRKLVSGSNLVGRKQVSCGCSRCGFIKVKKNGYKCIETGTIFLSSIAAAEFAGVSNGWQVIYACDGRLKSTGMDPETGNKYHWEFSPMTYYKFVGTTLTNQNKLYCVNTGKKYASPQQAAEKQLGHDKAYMGRYIKDVCDHYRWTAGKDPETGEALVWEWL